MTHRPQLFFLPLQSTGRSELYRSHCWKSVRWSNGAHFRLVSTMWVKGRANTIKSSSALLHRCWCAHIHEKQIKTKHNFFFGPFDMIHFTKLVFIPSPIIFTQFFFQNQWNKKTFSTNMTLLDRIPSRPTECIVSRVKLTFISRNKAKLSQLWYFHLKF